MSGKALNTPRRKSRWAATPTTSGRLASCRTKSAERRSKPASGSWTFHASIQRRTAVSLSETDMPAPPTDSRRLLGKGQLGAKGGTAIHEACPVQIDQVPGLGESPLPQFVDRRHG